MHQSFLVLFCKKGLLALPAMAATAITRAHARSAQCPKADVRVLPRSPRPRAAQCRNGARLHERLHAARGRGALRPGHRPVSVNKVTGPLFAAAPNTGRDRQTGRGRRRQTHKVDRPVARQGAQCRCPVGNPVAQPRAAKCPIDREALEALPGVGRKTAKRCAERGVRPKHDGRGHAYFPPRKPLLAWRPGKTPARGRGCPGQANPQGAAARRPSLADPARPLRLQGAPAGMLALRRRGRVVQIPGQNTGSRRCPGRRVKQRVRSKQD